MAVTRDSLKSQRQDYYIATWENDELIMEPFCQCGSELEEDFFCKACNRDCDCSFVLCRDHQALTVVEKFIHGNPNFRNYQLSLMGE
jgi:hypothetical protein